MDLVQFDLVRKTRALHNAQGPAVNCQTWNSDLQHLSAIPERWDLPADRSAVDAEADPNLDRRLPNPFQLRTAV